MNEIVTVNSNNLAIKEYNGQRVVTFKDIDEVHNRPSGTAKRNFNKNKEHLIENMDFYMITLKDENCTFGISIPNRGIIVFTETGYLMLVKSFKDDLSWEVQRQLVTTYFKAKEIAQDVQALQPISNTIIETLLQQNQSILQNLQAQQDNQNIYQTQSQQQIATLTALITAQLPQPYKPRYTRWMGKTYDKIDKLAEYNGIIRKQMLRKFYTEFQDTYDIDLGEYQEEYCAQHNLQDNGIYTLNVIDADYELKELFDLMLDTQIEQTELKLKEMA